MACCWSFIPLKKNALPEVATQSRFRFKIHATMPVNTSGCNRGISSRWASSAPNRASLPTLSDREDRVRSLAAEKLGLASRLPLVHPRLNGIFHAGKEAGKGLPRSSAVPLPKIEATVDDLREQNRAWWWPTPRDTSNRSNAASSAKLLRNSVAAPRYLVRAASCAAIASDLVIFGMGFSFKSPVMVVCRHLRGSTARDHADEKFPVLPNTQAAATRRLRPRSRRPHKNFR